MKVHIERNEKGDVKRLYVSVLNAKVYETTEMALVPHRGGGTISLDMNKKSEVLGVEVIGEIEIVDRTNATTI